MDNTLMNKIKPIIATLLLLLIGHVAFILAVGFGALVAVIWNAVPLWVIVVGSLLCSVSLFAQLLLSSKEDQR